MITLNDLDKLISDIYNAVDTNLENNAKVSNNLSEMKDLLGKEALKALRSGRPLYEKRFGNRREFIIKNKRGKKVFHRRLKTNPIYPWIRVKSYIDNGSRRMYLTEPYLPAKISDRVWGRIYGENNNSVD